MTDSNLKRGGTNPDPQPSPDPTQGEYDCEGQLCGSISGMIKLKCDCPCPEPVNYKTKLVPVPCGVDPDAIQAHAQNYLNGHPGHLLVQILDLGQHGWLLVIHEPV